MPGKFEGVSHAELYNMIATAKPSKLTEVGTALGDTYIPLHELADELDAHLKYADVDWEGEAAQAYREWGQKLVKQTRLMAEYTLLVGTNMGVAGQGLYDAQAHVTPPKHADTKGLSAEEKAAAHDDHQEALKAMDRLDNYYETAHTDISGLDKPNFPLLPEQAGGGVGAGQSPSGGENSYAAAAGGGGGTVPSKSFASAPHSSDGGGVTPISHPGVGSDGQVGSGVGAATAPPVTGTNIDSTTTAPPVDPIERPSLPTTPPVGPEQRTTGAGPFLPVPGPVVPGTGRGLPPGTTRMPNVPPALRGGPKPSPLRGPFGTPPGPTGRPLTPPRIGPQDGITSLSRPPRGPVSRLPKTPVVGEERPLMGRNPMGGGYHPHHTGPTTPGPNGAGRRLASERGGMVDRPNGKGPTNGQRLPRTTVVGEERGMPVRGPVGTGSHPATGGPHGPGGTGARRVSSEPGGVTGSPRASGKGRSEFTPGGTGLVRNAQTPGTVPSRAGAARPGDRQDQNGSRPDYLQEDEETWTGGRRDTVPPVID
ncbi:hypothetical protein HUT19_11190 [Streptomyces sp. NA02950]|uniref:hypothetical protein n=1 Tax=Streptomyces sp. NA02950 TaxID=2742137 RepID=UPI0015900DC8|nr:hypothetical protein [Streptomyces sp. NA02950]QKV92240.1 hypothetical protein HUT19_11190 [Streptomyces sp. NA02950]